MLQMLKNLQQQPQMPTDPNVMAQVKVMGDAAMAETNRKAAYDKADFELKAQKQNQDAQEKEASIVSTQQIETAKLTNDAATMTIEKQFEAKQAEAERAHQAQLANQEHLQAMQQAEQQAQQAAIQQQAVTQQPQGESNV
jgi:hypothetical protein